MDPPRQRMAAGKACDFMAIAATGHGTPAATTSARGIIKKQSTRGVGTDAKASAWAFGDELRCGTSDGCKQPFQTAFAGYEFQAPCTALLKKLVVPFGDAQDVVDGLDPVMLNGFLAEQCAKGLAQGCMQPLGFEKESAGALRVVLGESEQLGAAFRGNNACNQKKAK